MLINLISQSLAKRSSKSETDVTFTLYRHANNEVGGWTRRDGGPMKNKTHSADTKEKMSKSHTGIKHTEESRKKMSEQRKGRTWKMINGKRKWMEKV